MEKHELSELDATDLKILKTVRPSATSCPAQGPAISLN
jgi:hypothetical protein